MREIGRVTGRVFQHVMRRGGKCESDIAAFMEYEFRVRGCEGSAYIPVVAGGKVSLALSASNMW